MGAQLPASRATDSFVVVAPGARYARHPVLRTVLGARYRDLWATPIRIPLLDLRRVAGGLTPIRAHVGHQTRSLRFQGADGRLYQFRSVDKDPTAMLSEALRPSVAGAVLQDGVSSSMPAAALVASALLEAAAVLHVGQLLAQLPDDASLGSYRADFAGMIGMLEERPDDNDDPAIAFAGARRVISPTRLFERLDAGPNDRVDAHAFLTARLMDIFMGDRDRHRDQFRWASTDSGKVTYWRPISRDHDEAFVRIDGPALAIIRVYFPPLITFGETYPAHDKLNWHSREIDRRFPVSLGRASWDSVARALQRTLTDSVIDAAVRAMPAEMYRVGGASLVATLQRRRDRLVDHALSYYEFLAREVDVRGTNAADVVDITSSDARSLRVTIREQKRRAVPYFDRRFDVGETRELRLALWGADDSVIVHGKLPAGLRLRVVGGAGADVVVDSSTSSSVRLYDEPDGMRVVRPAGRRSVDVRPHTEWIGSDLDRYPPRDWGSWTRPVPWIEGNSDLGLSVGAGILHTRYGFRRQPYASHMRARIAYSSGGTAVRAELDGDVRRENRQAHWGVHLLASGAELLHYYGAGNQSPDAGGRRFHGVRQQVYAVEPSARFPVAPSFEWYAGPVVRWSRTGAEAGRFLAGIRDALYGGGDFGQLGGRIGFTLDTRDVPAHAHRGIHVTGEGRLVPAVWDVRRTYAITRLVASAYQSADVPLQPTLAVRVGGQRNVGTVPFQESAFLGGEGSVRGLPLQRYAGAASAFGNAELRVDLVGTQAIFPARWGGYAGADAGRVWAPGTPAGGWHRSVGGGAWVSFLDRAYSARLGLARSADETSVYVGAGLPF